MVKISIAVKDGKPVVSIQAETADDARLLMEIQVNRVVPDIGITWTPEAAELFWN